MTTPLRDMLAFARVVHMKRRARAKPPCQCANCLARREGRPSAGLAALLAALQQADDNELPATPTH
jgi:hypothetical protein